MPPSEHEMDLACEQMQQQQQQQQQQYMYMHMHMNMPQVNKNPAYGYWSQSAVTVGSPVVTTTAVRRVVDYDSDDTVTDPGVDVVSDVSDCANGSPTTAASTRSSGTIPSNHNHNRNHNHMEDEREEYDRRQHQCQHPYYPEEVDDDDDDNVVLWDRPSWTLSSFLPSWQWCVPGSTTDNGNGNGDGNVRLSNSLADLEQMKLHPSHQHQQQQQQQHYPYSTFPPDYYCRQPPLTPYQQQQQQQYAQYPSYPPPAQLQQHQMFVQQQQLQQGVLDHDQKSWSSHSAGSSISISGSSVGSSIGSTSSSSDGSTEPSINEAKADRNLSTPTPTPVPPAWQQQWTAATSNINKDQQHPPQASWNSGTTSSTLPPPPPPTTTFSRVPNPNKNGIILSQSFTNPSSPILAKPRLARRSNTTCGASSGTRHGSQLSVSVSLVSPKTMTTTTTTTSTITGSPTSLGRPPLLSRRGVSAPGSLRVSATSNSGIHTGPTTPQQQQALSPAHPPQHQRCPLQHHHPNLNHSNHTGSNSNNKPPRSNSMTKTGSSINANANTNTSPDVAVVLLAASTNTPTNMNTPTPTRPRLDSRDSSTGSLHRRLTGGASFEFSAGSLSEILAVPVVLTPAQLDVHSNSSSSSGNHFSDFPTTIEYRAALSYSYNGSLPVMSPNWVRGSSWSSCWTEEAELDQYNINNNDDDDDDDDDNDIDAESLWISDDEDDENGNVDANANTHTNVNTNANANNNASVSVRVNHPAAGEIERKHSLGYISPAEGDSSSSSLSSSSSSRPGSQENSKEEPEHQLQQQVAAAAAAAAPNDWMLQWAQQGTAPAPTPFATVESPAMVIDEDVATQEAEMTVDTGPVYLPVPIQDDKAKDESVPNNKVILSGWVAVSADDSLLIKLAASDGRPTLVRSDLALLELTCDSLILRRGANQDITVVPLSNDSQVSAQEISSRAGKCVVISKSSNTVCTILPVSLPRQFFTATGKELVETDRFDNLKSCMFTPFVVQTPTPLSKPAPARRTATCDLTWGQEYCVRHYAPNEQHDMARHLQFAVDSAIRML